MTVSVLPYLLLLVLISFGAVHWIFPYILWVAKTKGLVDLPDYRKLQEKAVPVLGGIAVFFGLLVGMMLFMALRPSPIPSDTLTLAPVLISASIMLYTGCIDDIVGLSPITRLVLETSAILGLILGTGTCIDNFHGLWGIGSLPMPVVIPLTILTGVGIINAYNMVDGVNGLSSGLCIAVCVIMGGFFFCRADYTDAAIAASLTGALIPFYLHNVFGDRSKMFIGDSGTMVMGLMISWFVIRALSFEGKETVSTPPNLIAMVLAVTCVPVFDTLRVMTFRIFGGRNPFMADKTHLHHAFIISGVSHFITGLTELGINLLVIAIWFLCYRAGLSQETQLYATIITALITVWGTYLFLHYQEKRNTPRFRRFKNFTKATHLGAKPGWIKFQKFVDYGTKNLF